VQHSSAECGHGCFAEAEREPCAGVPHLGPHSRAPWGCWPQHKQRQQPLQSPGASRAIPAILQQTSAAFCSRALQNLGAYLLTQKYTHFLPLGVNGPPFWGRVRLLALGQGHLLGQKGLKGCLWQAATPGSPRPVLHSQRLNGRPLSQHWRISDPGRLYCTALYCTVLCCTVLYCAELYCSVV